MKRRLIALIGALTLLAGTPAKAEQPLTVLAAGSLREALTAIAGQWAQQGGGPMNVAYGPSGKLREQIESGKAFDVFASASLDHVQALHAAKRVAEARTLLYNSLCIVSRPGLEISAQDLHRQLVDPSLRLATSTPVSDPMGDYTWQFFRKLDATHPGTYDRLNAKALKLSGAIAPAPGSKPPYVKAFEDDKADAYVMYCTNAASTLTALPTLRVMRIPDAFNVRSEYGVGAAPGSKTAQAFVDYLFHPNAQAIFQRLGFQ